MTQEESRDDCCVSCQLNPSCASSAFLSDADAAALLRDEVEWLNGTDAVANCFMAQRARMIVPVTARNLTWETAATVCELALPEAGSGHGWSAVVLALLPFLLRAAALAALAVSPAVHGLSLVLRLCGAGGAAASPTGGSLTESLAGGAEPPALPLPTGSNQDTACPLSTEKVLAVDGTYVEQRAVVAVQTAEAASESEADAAAKASYGVLTGSGHSTMGYMGMEYSRAQSSWEMCRVALGLSVAQAKLLSAERLVLWYWLQPLVAVWVLRASFCELGTELRWQGSIVIARELSFFLATIVAALPCACPGYLLLNVRLMSTPSRASELTEGAETPARRQPSGAQVMRLSMYVLAPHHFVTLCLVRRFGIVWGLLGVLHLLADAHSLTALWLLLSEPSPALSLAIGNPHEHFRHFLLRCPGDLKGVFVWAGYWLSGLVLAIGCAIVAWRLVQGARMDVPERPKAGTVCVGVAGCIAVAVAAAVVALVLLSLLVPTGLFAPSGCYDFVRDLAADAEEPECASGSNMGERFGFTCVGLQCAAGPPLGTVLGQATSCAEAAPDGYVLNPELGVCEAP